MIKKIKEKIKSLRQNRKGFTLIELIVVMAVLGFLVALAVPKFIGYTQKAEVKRIQSDTRAIGTLVDAHLVTGEKLEGVETLQDTELQNYINEGRLYDLKGQAANVKPGEYTLLGDNFTSDSKLEGQFYANDMGDIYYVHNKVVNADNAENAGSPDSENTAEDTSSIVEFNAYMGGELYHGILHVEVVNSSNSNIYVPGLIHVIDSQGSGRGVGTDTTYVVSPGNTQTFTYNLWNLTYEETETYSIDIFANNYDMWGAPPLGEGDTPTEYYTFISFTGEYDGFYVQETQFLPQEYPVDEGTGGENEPNPDPLPQPDPLFDANEVAGQINFQSFTMTDIGNDIIQYDMTIQNNSGRIVYVNEESIIYPQATEIISFQMSKHINLSIIVNEQLGTIMQVASYSIPISITNDGSGTNFTPELDYTNTFDIAGAAG